MKKDKKIVLLLDAVGCKAIGGNAKDGQCILSKETKIDWDLTPQEAFKSKVITSRKEYEQMERELEKRAGKIYFYVDVWNMSPTLNAMAMEKYTSKSVPVQQPSIPVETLIEAVKETGGAINISGHYPINEKIRKRLLESYEFNLSSKNG